MNKNIKMQELKRWLKSSLKNKVSINDRTIMTFLMAGFLGLSTLSYSDYVISNNEKSSQNFEVGIGTVFRGTNRYTTRRTASVTLTDHVGPDNDVTRNNEPIQKVTLVGIGTRAIGAQAVGLGSNAVAAYQATAIGSDVFATGHSSIAIGNDDISTEYKDKLPGNIIKRIYKDAGKDTALNNGLSWSDFASRYVGRDGNTDREVWSPTYARGIGSIAIGSRSVAFEKGTTALGTLTFALAEGSTAVGLRAFTHFDATGSTAIGEEARTFASNTISIGNRTEATSQGSLAFGNLSRAVGKGSIAIGESVASNANLDENNFKTFKEKIDEYTQYENYKSGNKNTLVDAGFVSKQNQKVINTYIDSIISSVNKFKYKQDGETVISINQTPEGAIKKTAKLGDHAVSLGYYVLNTGDNTVGIGTASRIHGANSVAIGALNVIDDKASNAIAIGVGTRVEKENTLAFGTGALGLGAGSIILGAGAVGTKDSTIAVGYGSESKATSGISFGSSAKILEGSDSSIAIGNDSIVNENSKNSTAIGRKAQVLTGKIAGLAIGNETVVSLANSTALGYRSKTDYTENDLKEPGYTPRGSYTIPTSARIGVISIGSKGEERRLTNLASGYRDTDAVNVAQLRALEDRFEFSISGLDDKAINYVSINSDSGDSRRIKDIALKEIHYKEYVKLKKLEAILAVRAKSGDELDQKKTSELNARIAELENSSNGETFKAAAADLLSEIDKIRRPNGSNPYGTEGALFKRDDAYAAIDNAEKTADDNIGDVVSEAEKQLTKGTNYDNKGAKSQDSISIGYKAFVEANSHNSIAIGRLSKVNTNTKNSVALGAESQVGTNNNVVVENAIAVGHKAKAEGNRTVVIGAGAKAENDGAISIGYEASVSGSANGLALGRGAKVNNKAGGVAIGYQSEATRNNNVNGYDPLTNAVSTNNNSTWRATHAGFSVGNDNTVTRQITGVAAGKEDTDAVNVAQLKRLKEGLSVKYFSVKSTQNGNKDNDGAIHNDTVAIGPNARAEGHNSVAIGHNAKTENAGSLALGYNSKVAGDNSVGLGINITFEKENNTKGDYTVAVGSSITVSKNASYSVAVGKSSSITALGTVAVGENSKAQNERATAIGNNSSATGKYSTSLGFQASTNKEGATALGNNSSATENNSTAIGRNAGVSVEHGIALGSYSIGNRESGLKGFNILEGKDSTSTDKKWQSTRGALSVGETHSNGNVLHTRQIINVAAGTKDTDAVNVAQLKEVKIKFASQNKTANKVSKVSEIKDGLTFKSLSDELSIEAKDTGLVEFKINSPSVANNTLTFKADNALEFKRKNSENKKVEIKSADFNITQGTSAGAAYKGKNLATLLDTSDNGNTANIKIGLKDEVEFTKVTITNGTSNGPVLSTSGIAMNNNKISGLAKATADNDAVRFDQLKDLEGVTSAKILSKIDKGNVVQGDGITIEGTKENRLLGNGNLTIKLDPALKAKIDNLPTNVASAENTITFKGSLNNNTYVRKNSENKTLNIIEGDVNDTFKGANLKTSIDNQGNLKIGFSKTPTFDSLSITGGPSLSSAGLNMNNKPITNLGDAQNDKDAPTYKQLKDLVGVLEATVTSKVTKGNLKVEDGLKFSDGSGDNRLIGQGDLKITLDDATKAKLNKIGAGNVALNDENTVTGDKVKKALDALTLKYSANNVSKTTTLTNGLTFKSSDSTVSITAKDNGEIDLSVAPVDTGGLLNKNLGNIEDAGKNKIKDFAIEAINVIAKEGDTNPITVEPDTSTANKKTFKISVDNEKLKNAIGLPSGKAAKDNDEAITGGKVFDAVKNAKTKVDKKANETFITVDKTESDDITANEYKIGLAIEPLKAELANSFAKKDASNITEVADKNKWREALDLYTKDEVNTKVKAATERVINDNNGIVTVTEANSTNGSGKVFTVGLTADKVKEAAGTTTLGALSTENSELVLTGDGANKLIGGDLKIGLSEAVKATLAKVGVGVISDTDNKKDNTVTGKAVFDFVNPIKTDVNNLKENSLTFKADDNTSTNNAGYVRKNNENKTISIISGNLDNSEFVGDNLKTSVDTNGNITIGIKKSPKFETIIVGTNKDNTKNVNINDDGIDLKDRLISGLKNGTADNEAVNVSQLKPLATALGANVENDGKITAPTYTLENGKTTSNAEGKYSSVPTALKALDDAITNKVISYSDGTNNKSVKLSDGLKFTTANDLLTIEAKENGEVSFKINSPNTADNTITFGAENNVNFARKNSESKSVNIISGAVDNTVSGDNIVTALKVDEQDANKANILIGLKKEVTFDKVSISNGPELSNTGLNMNNKGISNLVKGKSDNDAVNLSQLKPLATALGANAAIDANGDLTAPTYSLKAGNEAASNYSNVGAGLTALDNAITAIKGADFTDEGKEKVKNLARDAVKVKVDETQKDNPITVNAVKDGDENTTYKIGIDIEKIKQQGGLSGGEVADNETKTVTGDKVFDAITKAKTKVDLENGEQYLSLTKVEPNDTNPNKYTIGLKLTELTTKLGETFAKKDASNITEANDKTAWRNALDVYDKSHVDGLKLKYNITGSTEAAKETKLSEGIKFKTSSDKLTIKANNGGEIEFGLNLPTNIPENVADGTKSLTVKASINNPDTGYVKTNNDDRSLTFIEGDITDGNVNYKSTNLKTSIDASGVIKIGFKEDAEFKSIKIKDGPTLTDAGINLNGDKITNLGKGIANGDAINKEQIDQLLTKIGGGISVGADGSISNPTFKLKAGQTQPTEENAAPVTKDYNTVSEALTALDEAIEHVKNAEFTDKGKEDVKNLAREAVKVKAKEDANNAIIVDAIKTQEENTTYSLFVEKTDTISRNAGLAITPAPTGQDEPKNHPNRLVTEKAVVDFIKPLEDHTLTFNADNNDAFVRNNNSSKVLNIKSTTNAITNVNGTTDVDKYLGTNLTTKIVKNQDNNTADILIGFKETPTFKEVFATDKIAIGTPNSSSVALTKDGVDAGNKAIFNVGKGVSDTDAVNISQLKPLIEKLGGSLNITDNKGTVNLPNFELKTGATAPNNTKTYSNVSDAIKAIDEKLSQTATGNANLTFSDGTAANDFVRGNNENKTIKITKADNENNISVSLSKTGDTGTFKIALANELKNISSITNGTGNDTKSKITLGDNSIKLEVETKELTIAKSGTAGKEGISITGLEERNISSQDYGTNTNASRAATEGAVKHLSDVLGGNVAVDNNTGPAGKDGLNGKSIVEKVEGLRNGQSGPMVYTDKNGNRLIKDGTTGKYYVMKEDGTKDESKEIPSENVILSLVDPNGETKSKPINIANVASALDLDKEKPNSQGAYNKPISEADAKSVIGGLLTKSEGLNKAVSLADLQALAIAGLDFEGNIGTGNDATTKKSTHRKLSETLKVVGSDVNTFDNHSTVNVATRVSEGKIEIGFKKSPEFESLKLKNLAAGDENKVITLTPNNEGNKLTISGEGNKPVELDGIAAGTSPNSAVNKAQLDELANKLGDVAKDGTDGRNGAKGLDGSNVAKTNFGPAGKDGLNGKDLNEKVNALRRGEAGPVVYTDLEGNRLVKGLDGKLYKLDDIKDKVYVEGTGYVNKNETTTGTDGSVTANPGATPATAVDPGTNNENVRLAGVNIDGTTTTPTVLTNIASGLDPKQIGKDAAAVMPDVAKKLIGGDSKNQNDKGLLGLTDKAKLNTVATVGDLQALAQAGLDFKANTGDTIHRPLSSHISIIGKEDNKYEENKFSFDNVVTATDAGNYSIKIGFAKTPRFDAIELGEKPKDTNTPDKKITITPNTEDGKITFKNDPGTTTPNGGTPDTRVVIEGIKDGDSPDSAVTKGKVDKIISEIGIIGKDGKDGRDGSKSLDGKDTTGYGPAGKDGLNGESLLEKVNALRRGEAGPVVYTDHEGNRLIKGHDGKLYKQDDLKDKVYVEHTDGTNGYVAKDKAMKQADGTYKLNENETPSYTDAFALTEHEEKVKHSLVNIDGTTTKPSKLSNLAEGEISATSKDAINGSQLFALAGNTARDGIDGRNGLNGLDGTKATNGKEGPAGKDGLNGTSVNEKANALRRGEAGPVVYTKEDGTRLAKANDGKLYDKENVTAAGDLIKDNYVKVINPETLEATYYNKDSIDENGVLKKDATPLANDEKTAAETAFNTLESTDKDKVVHSLVNIDGTTNAPSILRNIASGLDPEVIGKTNTPLTEDAAKKLIGGDKTNNKLGLLGLTEVEKLNRAATIGDLQALAIAGLDFEGNVAMEASKGKITHRKLSEKLQIIGKEGVTSFDDYSTDNIATRVSEGKIEIGFKKSPEFESLKLKNLAAGDENKVITLTPNNEGNKLTISGEGNKPVELDGIAAGTSPNSAVNKAQLDELAKKSGDSSKDGEDGRNGAKGLDGQDAANKDAGAAGKDGLNGKDLNEKVNALRRGEAGPVVYTDLEGNRLVKGLDGKLYKPENIKDKVFVENVGYVDKANTTENDGVYSLNQGLDANNVEKAEVFEAGENNKNVRLSAVNIDGSTNKPTTFGNIASGIDPSKIGTNNKAIEKADAKAAVDTLLKIDKKDKLNTASTVGDLQALAKAGLEFVSNNGEVHRELGTKLSIVGAEKETGKTYSTKNITTEAKIENNIAKLEIKIAEKPEFKGLELVTTPTNPGETPTKIKFDPTKDGINFTKDPATDGDNKIVITGVKDGTTPDSVVTKGTVDKIIEQLGTVAKDGEDGRNGANGLDGQAAENKDAGAAGKDGLNGKDLNEKVNALRRGEAGPVVYTDLEGNRLVKGHDGRLYKPADIENKVFIKDLGYVAEDLANKAEDGTYTLKDPNTADTVAKATPFETGNNNENVKHSLVNIDGTTTTPSKLSNVADGEISEKSTDAINGSQLHKLAGNIAKDGEDGRNGAKGLDGKDAENKDAGAAGKDGLNGKDLNEKANALRRGEAGPVVYTDLEGNRLVKGHDGKLYNPKNLKDKVYVDGVGYVSNTDAKLKEDGSGYELNDNVTADNVDKVASFDAGENNEKVRLSAVNIDGTTTKPTTFANIASGIDSTKIGTDNKAIEKADAIAAVGTLLKVDKKDKLNTASTVGDLQALAQAGLTFKGNKDTDIHKPLGTILTIKGEGTGTGENFESASGNILVDNNAANDGLEIKLSKALANLKSISFESDNDGPKGVITGLKDLDDNSDGSSAANKNYVDEKLGIAKDASSGIANAIAMSNLTQVQHRGGYRHQISAGYGTYNGEHAFGVGLSGISKGGQVMYKASGSLNTRGKFAAGVGVGYQFDKEEIIEDEVVVNLKNEVKKSQDEASMLKSKLSDNENRLKENEAKLDDNNREIKELKEQLSNLVKKVSENYQELKQELYMVNAYDVDSYLLNDRQERELKAIIDDLNTNHKNKIVDITGYADITSNEKYNLEIGLNRARYIAEKLIEFGLDESIIIRKVNSQGHNSIVDTNTNAKGRLTNRRVEISVK